MDMVFWAGLSVAALVPVIMVVRIWRGADVTRGFRRGHAAVSIAGLALACVGALGGTSPWVSKALTVGFAVAFGAAIFVLGFVLNPSRPAAPRR